MNDSLKRVVRGAVAAQLLLGCGEVAVPPDVGADAWRYDAGAIGMTDRVDLVLVVDDEVGNAAAGQAMLAYNLTSDLVDRLVRGDRDGDAVADGPALTVRVGVTTGDLGAGPVADAANCQRAGLEGAFVREAAGPGCPTSYPSGIFEFDAAHPVGTEINCVGPAASDRDGCFWQQPLESILLALTPTGARPPWTRDDYSPPVFDVGRTPQTGTGRANDGFLRDDSVLVVLFSSPADDCSTATPEIFSESAYPGLSPSLRCLMHPDPLYPVERYVNGLLGLRRSPSRVVVGAFVGVPVDAELLSYEDVLARQELQIRQVGSGQAPSCDGLGLGAGYPARRFLSLLVGLRDAGSQTVLASVCNRELPIVRLYDAITSARAGRP